MWPSRFVQRWDTSRNVFFKFYQKCHSRLFYSPLFIRLGPDGSGHKNKHPYLLPTSDNTRTGYNHITNNQDRPHVGDTGLEFMAWAATPLGLHLLGGRIRVTLQMSPIWHTLPEPAAPGDKGSPGRYIALPRSRRQRQAGRPGTPQDCGTTELVINSGLSQTVSFARWRFELIIGRETGESVFRHKLAGSRPTLAYTIETAADGEWSHYITGFGHYPILHSSQTKMFVLKAAIFHNERYFLTGH